MFLGGDEMKILLLVVICFMLINPFPALCVDTVSDMRQRFNRMVDRGMQKMSEEAGQEVPTFEELEERRNEEKQEYNEWLQEQKDYDPELDYLGREW